MSVEIGGASVICYKCGTAYSRKKGYFPVSYAPLYKGLGYIPVCKDCLDAIYQQYYVQCHDAKTTIRQMCRKLDLYWDEKVFNMVEPKSTAKTILTKYLTKLNSSAYLGKCYDDTLIKEGTLWVWDFDKNTDSGEIKSSSGQYEAMEGENEQELKYDVETAMPESQIFIEIPEDFVVTDDVVAFWGSGYTRTMYGELEQRRKYWMQRFPDDYEIDVGTEALIKQICSLEIDINRDRIAGKAVDKSVTVLNTLLGSANLKPKSKDSLDDSFEKTPYGVWIWRFENERPIPEVDPELEDVDGILKYVLTWVFGHIAKMLSVKNLRSKLYEKAIEKYRVAHPEYDDDEDDEMLYDIFGGDDAYSDE